MPIETVGGFEKVLTRMESRDWINQYKDLPLKEGENSSQEVKSFSQFLAEGIEEVNKLQNQANVAIQKLASGESKDIHETLLAVEQADLAFQMMNKIRGKVISAYQEVMRMQI